MGRRWIIYLVDGGPWIINDFGWNPSVFEPDSDWDDDSDDSNDPIQWFESDDPSDKLPTPPEGSFLLGYTTTEGIITPAGRIWSAIEDARQGGDELHTALCENYFADASASREVALFRCDIT
jgi:hypothetical protein